MDETTTTTRINASELTGVADFRVDQKLSAIRDIINILNGIAPRDRCHVIAFVHQHFSADVNPYGSAQLGALAGQMARTL